MDRVVFLSTWVKFFNDFLAAPFFTAHPQFKWQAKYLHDMKSNPWTLFGARK
jgi:hypothetical protein